MVNPIPHRVTTDGVKMSKGGVRQDSKSANMLKKLKAEGLSKREIDQRLKQSLQDRRKELIASEGGGPRQRSKYSNLGKAGGSAKKMARRVNTYLASIANPEHYMSIIPDMTTFPRAVMQIVTVGTWTTSIGGTGLIYLAPGLAMSGECGASSTLAIDGVNYTNIGFNVHGFGGALLNNVGSYRVVSMCARVDYIGNALQNQGQIAMACLPPTDALFVLPSTFSSLAEYNYSYVGAAAQGAYHIWMPASAIDFAIRTFNSVVDSTTTPILAIAIQGCQASTAVFNVTWTINIEAFSFQQILTATKSAGKPDMEAMSHALGSVSKAVSEGNAGGPSTEGGSVFQSVMGALGTAGKFAWDNRSTIATGLEMGAAMLL